MNPVQKPLCNGEAEFDEGSLQLFDSRLLEIVREHGQGPPVQSDLGSQDDGDDPSYGEMSEAESEEGNQDATEIVSVGLRRPDKDLPLSGRESPSIPLPRREPTPPPPRRSNNGMAWDNPIGLAVASPVAVDLRQVWRASGNPEPPVVQAALGPQIPVLLCHVVTPIAAPRKRPARVWSLGYEFVPRDSSSLTVSVVPSDDVLLIGSISQEVSLGLDFHGKIGVPQTLLQPLPGASPFQVGGAHLSASTDQKFGLSLKMRITLRKVVGAPHGNGGAVWHMYRQDERLDRPHALFHTILVPHELRELNCTIRTWATQAGWFNTGIRAKSFTYDDAEFTVSLQGLSTDAT